MYILIILGILSGTVNYVGTFNNETLCLNASKQIQNLEPKEMRAMNPRHYVCLKNK